MTIEIPYYERKTSYGKEKLTMPICKSAQEVDIAEFQRVIDAIGDIYSAFRLIWSMEQANSARILRTLPVDFNKAEFLEKSFRNPARIPAPINSIARLDVVNEKIVDINNKPAGAGLITTTENVWSNEGVWPMGTLPIKADLSRVFDSKTLKRIIVATKIDYVFSSDQAVLSRNIEEQTGIKTMIVNPQEQRLDELESTDAVLCFSYPELRRTESGWVSAMFKKQDRFFVNPLASLVWDNKALMSLPFLKMEGVGDLENKLSKLRDVFPITYLVREKPDGNFEIATELTKDGVQYSNIDMDNIPTELCKLGEIYIKPLGQSGGRDIVIKNFQDRGGVFSCIKKYGTSRPGIVIQKTVIPQTNVRGAFIKDGYFFDSRNSQFITIERMQSVDRLKIHGGSQTELVPVYLKGNP